MRVNPINLFTVTAFMLFAAKLFSPYCQDLSWWWPVGIILFWMVATVIVQHRIENRNARLARGYRR